MRLPLACLIALLCCAPLSAGVIATDGEVPASMNAGGTADDPADYIIRASGPVTWTLGRGNISIGNTTSYNRLIIRNGSTYDAPRLLVVGKTVSATHNHLLLIGAARVTAISLLTGDNSSHNQVTIEAGSTISVTRAFLGYESTASHNRLHVTSADSKLVTGALDFGPGNDNRLLVAHSGLVTLGALPTFDPVGTGNFIGLNGGYLAVAGDQRGQLAALLAGEHFRHWDQATGDWLVSGFSDLNIDYFADESAALNFSGYTGLADYTIITVPLAAVPEPATYAALAGLAALALAALRRRDFGAGPVSPAPNTSPIPRAGPPHRSPRR